MNTVVWLLRAIICISGMYQLAWGNPLLGGILLGSLGAIVFPKYYTKNAISSFPFEIELVLLVIALVTGVLGETQDFYNKIPYYDKFVHALIPFFMGLFGFLIVYALQAAGRIQLPYYLLIPFVILTMLGIQTFWEIFEYMSDTTRLSVVLAWEQAQGNALENPHQDTMNDLVVDMFGTITGTFLAFSFVKNGKRNTHARIRVFIEEMKTKFKQSHIRPHRSYA